MISFTKIKDQIKKCLTLKDIYDFYVGGKVGYNKRYKCPFNLDEEHYNFEIKDRTWRCYSCGESGDEIAFVKKLFNYSTYKEALLRLANDFGLDTSAEIDEKFIERLRIEKEKREKREKEKRYKTMLKQEEISLLNKLLHLEKVIMANMEKVKPYNHNNLGKYRYTSLASEFLKSKQKLDRVKILIDIITNQDVDLQIYLKYNISIGNKNHKEMLKDKIIKLYVSGEIIDL